jgi:(p)ppGpp synthase/HD superfamily hydrolase
MFMNISGKSDLELIAEDYAFQCHEGTNHHYNDQPYHFHLKMVVVYAQKYLDLIRLEKREFILAAAWCHDVIEDTRQTYNDVKKVIGEEAAEIVYALTNEKGRNRKERANEKYYKGIQDTPGAAFVKICDRLANVNYSKRVGSRMLQAYWTEQPIFSEYLYKPQYNSMFQELNKMISYHGE